MSAPPVLRIAYSDTAPRDAGALACLAYPPASGGLTLPLTTLDGAPAWETWRTAAPARNVSAADVIAHEDGTLLCATWIVDDPPAADAELEARTAQVYRELSAFCAARGYPAFLKIWHYFARINEGEGDEERYRRFCRGRAAALPAAGLPAATAIGAPDRAAPLVVTVLAAREPGRPVENPRQVPAPDYPRRYGPEPPRFARAMLAPWGQLLVSGTAAVVGHESRHAGDAMAQLAEAAENLRVLVAQAEALAGHRLRPQALKFFVRDPAQAAALRAAAPRWFGAVPALWLRGDICRSDLLVEFEGLYDPA